MAVHSDCRYEGMLYTFCTSRTLPVTSPHFGAEMSNLRWEEVISAWWCDAAYSNYLGLIRWYHNEPLFVIRWPSGEWSQTVFDLGFTRSILVVRLLR